MNGGDFFILKSKLKLPAVEAGPSCPLLLNETELEIAHVNHETLLASERV